MDEPTLDSLERQLASVPVASAPAEMRLLVLANLRSHLKAQRWDRRMARVAVLLLTAGIGLNATAGWRSGMPAANPSIADSRPDAIARAAVFMADATDAETGRDFARHLAALGGTTLSSEQEAAIRRQIETHSKSAAAHRKDG